jgi:hypothetical protein
MTKNEWITIKSLLQLEIEKAKKKDVDFVLTKPLNDIYFAWIEKAERHIRLAEIEESKDSQ